jgi:DNA invertase Pin-like site-specific DNA recombinase
MPTILGGLAEFERELIRARTGEGRERAKAGRENGTEAETHRAPDPRGGRAARQRRNGAGYRSDLARVTCNAMASGDALMPIRPEYRWFL